MNKDFIIRSGTNVYFPCPHCEQMNVALINVRYCSMCGEDIKEWAREQMVRPK